MRPWMTLAAALLLIAVPAQAGTVVFSKTRSYVGGAPGFPFPGEDGSLGTGHFCGETNGWGWTGCVVFDLSALPAGDYEITLSVTDDHDPLISFDWQLYPEPGQACAAPVGSQRATGSVTFLVSGECGNLWTWPGVGATTGTASVVVEAI